jgi:putative phosphoesterase
VCRDFETARRILIVSDTHGVLDEPIRLLATESDLVLHAGDIGDYGVLRDLGGGGAPVVAVLGNNDVGTKWPVAQRRQLARLPLVAKASLKGGLLVVEHGHRAGRVADRHRLLRVRYPDARAVIYGHSHRLCCDTETRPWVLNPGAAGRARTQGGATCLTLRVSPQGRWRLQVHRFTGG